MYRIRHNHARRIAAALALVAAAGAIVAARADQALKYKEFPLGLPKGEARAIIAQGYRGAPVREDADAGSLTITVNEQNEERIILRFDNAGALYSINAHLGRDKDSIYLSKLLNFLENKYGKTTVESGGKDRGFIWRAVWNLQKGRYGISAEFTGTGVSITYRDIPADDRMRGELLKRRYAAFKDPFIKASGSAPATLQFAGFRLGDSRQAVIARITRAAGAPQPFTEAGKCRNGKAALKAVIPDTPDGREPTGRAEMMFFFDTNDSLFEIVLHRPGADRQYLVDLLRYLREAAGEPTYTSDEMLIGRWEFNGGTLLLTASFTDRPSVSLLDKGRLDRCISDVESKLFKDL